MVGLLHRSQLRSPTDLSTTAQAVLASATADTAHIVTLPERLPIAAQRAVVKSMLAAGFIEEVPAAAGQLGWRISDSGEPLLLRATQLGLGALADAQGAAGMSGPEKADTTAAEGDTAHSGAVAREAPLSPRVRLRAAAEAVVAAWTDKVDGDPILASAIEALRTALAIPGRTGADSRSPRTGTKQQAVLGLLRRPEGASVAQVAEATGWAQHTVRGFFAGLKKKGISVSVLERVRQVGSGKQGAKGSYTVYRVTDAG